MTSVALLNKAFQPLLALAERLDEAQGWTAINLPGWTVRDLVFHLAADCQRALVALDPSTDEFAAQRESTHRQRQGGNMRNEAMEKLGVLAGSWQTTMRNAWFLEPADLEVPGTATVEWLGDAFVVVRWTMAGDVGSATSEMVLVLGHSDAHRAYTALYHDERGVCRVFAMAFDGAQWNLGREDPDMFQRFIAEVGPDRIAGRWEASEDHGSTWRKDFDLVFERA